MSNFHKSLTLVIHSAADLNFFQFYFILNLIISSTTEKLISIESPSLEMEKKIASPLPPKASATNEKSKNSPSSKNLMTELEENIRLKPQQPVLKNRYVLIFA